MVGCGWLLHRSRGLTTFREAAKPSVAKAKSGWYWETVKVFRWEFGWKVPLRQKLRLRTPRSKRSASPGRKAGRGRSPNGGVRRRVPPCPPPAQRAAPPQAERPAAAEAQTGDCGPGLRLRSAARAMEE